MPELAGYVQVSRRSEAGVGHEGGLRGRATSKYPPRPDKAGEGSMSSEARRMNAVMRAGHERLSGMVEPLDANGIRARSYCKDWNIAQVLSHLGSQTEIFGQFLDAAVSGAEPPAMEWFAPIWQAWNERSPEAQVADSLAVNMAFLGRLEGLSDAEIDGLAFSATGMELDAVGVLRLRLGEHTLHTWDVEVALDPKATLYGDAVGDVLDNLGMMVQRGGKPQGQSFVLDVRTTTPSGLSGSPWPTP